MEAVNGYIRLAGLDTRDMIALVAMHGIVSGTYRTANATEIAESAYRLADAMIAQGQKGSR